MKKDNTPAKGPCAKSKTGLRRRTLWNIYSRVTLLEFKLDIHMIQVGGVPDRCVLYVMPFEMPSNDALCALCSAHALRWGNTGMHCAMHTAQSTHCPVCNKKCPVYTLQYPLLHCIGLHWIVDVHTHREMGSHQFRGSNRDPRGFWTSSSLLSNRSLIHSQSAWFSKVTQF